MILSLHKHPFVPSLFLEDELPPHTKLNLFHKKLFFFTLLLGDPTITLLFTSFYSLSLFIGVVKLYFFPLRMPIFEVGLS